MALDQLVFGIIILILGLVLLKLKRRAYTFYDDMFDALSPDRPTRGLRRWHKVPYLMFMLSSLVGGVYFILWSAYTALQS